MIPKIIHYAWFGTDMPDEVKKRVENWKKVLPEWKFMFWNEQNFDVQKFKFTYNKYKEKNWGFTADEVRYWSLYNYGGFYLDTDMILKKSLNEFLDYSMVWGFQYDNSLLTSFIGSQKNESLLLEILDVYEGKKFNELREEINKKTSNPIITKIFLKEPLSFETNGKFQVLPGNIIVFPKDYFCYPSKNKNANFSEHIFDNSWGRGKKGLKNILKKYFKFLFPLLWVRISEYRGIKSAELDGVPLNFKGVSNEKKN